MYSQLYEIWKQELEEHELVNLPKDFYPGIVEYVKRLKEESRMLDRRTVKASILRKEMNNVRRMVREMVWMRHKKILNKAAKGEEVSQEALTVEEEQIYSKISSLCENISSFAAETLQGHEFGATGDAKHKRTTVRLLKDVPAIVGADMKTYGPFKTEDVATLPLQNAKVLVNQNLAEKIETS